MHITEITEGARGKIRVRLEDGTVFLLYKKEAAEYDLKEGGFLNDDQWDRIKSEILLKRAKKRALYLLQKMDRTEKQLREKLQANEYPSDIIDGAIAYVKSFHYIDDERYARNYIYCQQERKSQRQMRMDLMRKGVCGQYIDCAMEEMLEIRPEELICKWLDRKNYDPEQADESEKRRVYQFLLRKGFHSDEIIHCMRVNA